MIDCRFNVQCCPQCCSFLALMPIQLCQCRAQCWAQCSINRSLEYTSVILLYTFDRLTSSWYPNWLWNYTEMSLCNWHLDFPGFLHFIFESTSSQCCDVCLCFSSGFINEGHWSHEHWFHSWVNEDLNTDLSQNFIYWNILAHSFYCSIINYIYNHSALLLWRRQ